MIKVVCAIVEQYERVLVTQRSKKMREALLWEFPGGKLEQNETEGNCLIREIQEELGIEVEPYQRLTPAMYAYPDLSIELIPFLCKYKGGVIQLQEHRTYHWVKPEDLKTYQFCPADVPILEEYLQLIRGRP
ncbi:(deoxy)nucleoside triphosphate pyrophosphohydrolase [Pontibacter anaerobius]|uniref:8-oxo-dGTP diphosphatase n=1 Tax=Pontibacter anaerobius TaxID=2993940 RepID=A0ABT3RDC5_9BACT|nr:(deoxy)nucleoside triphosphate pyrophosphohydrolase [Pontibacter anaerobius]MCX2739372.1 (deoxy)nucleoside triphosphate pyrophosphohydrolase [Pontibacter anaerobius]